MNERIFELAKQADLIQWDTLPSGARTPDHESVVKARKFAELIVKECMEQVWYTREDMINDNVSEVIKLRIKEHFGVEE
jgi:hypothetical protein